MEKKIAVTFNQKVEELFQQEGDCRKLYTILRSYERSHDVSNLVNELKGVLCEPNLLRLYDDIRPLVPVKQQIEYDQLIPKRPSDKLRLIKLQRRPNQALGFAVRGGLEHGVGLYISEVVPNSQASEVGLQVGDEILRLNGYSISQAIHQEALQYIKAKKELELRVRYIGMIPVKKNVGDKVTWKHINGLDLETTVNKEELKDVQLSINLPVGASLGCSICSGSEKLPGIFIQSVKVGGLAQEAGLEVGDQLIDVNGTAFFNITHSQAVVALKGSRMLNITVRKRVGYKVFGSRGTPLTEDEEKALHHSKRSLKGSCVGHDVKQNGTHATSVDGRNVKTQITVETKQGTGTGNAKVQSANLVKEVTQIFEASSSLDYHEPLHVHTSNTQPTGEKADKQKLSPIVPMYMTARENPSFRIQKPVLLHPTRRPSETQKTLKENSEVDFPEGGFTQENFMPTRLFTNEQIAGRQIKLLNLIKNVDSASDLGLELEVSTPLHQGSTALLVKDITPGGEIHKQGGIHKGDEVLIVDSNMLICQSLDSANRILQQAYTDAKESLQLIIAKALPSDMNTEITYF